jgi:DNA repair protein RadC
VATPFTVHDLPVQERPRERMVAVGAESLSAQELLALVLGRGIQGESVLVTAQKLLTQFGSLESILQASLADLQKVRGLGIAKSTQLKACLEIARRVSAVQVDNKQAVMNPADVYALVKAKISQESKEHFVVLSFDVRNRFLGLDVIAIGILNASVVHPRELFESAIRRHAAHVMVSHNHPSGVCDPSDEDIEMTNRLVEAGKIMGISVVDHVIVSKNSFYSFAENGLI